MEELQVPLDPSHMFDKPDVGESDDKESKLQWVEKKYRGSSGSSKVCITVLFQQISCAMKKVVHYFIQQNVSKENRIACCSLDHGAMAIAQFGADALLQYYTNNAE
jgi:hypothetical protein